MKNRRMTIRLWTAAVLAAAMMCSIPFAAVQTVPVRTAAASASGVTRGAIDPLDVYRFFHAPGITDVGIAAIASAYRAESVLIPTNLEDTREKQLGSDMDYLTRTDSGQYTGFSNDRAGWGLAQWTSPDRKARLLAFCRARGASVGNAEVQMAFTLQELEQDSPALLWKLRASSTTLSEAVRLMTIRYEAPADQSERVIAKRTQFAQGYYATFSALQGAVPETVEETPALPTPPAPFLTSPMLAALPPAPAPSTAETFPTLHIPHAEDMAAPPLALAAVPQTVEETPAPAPILTQELPPAPLTPDTPPAPCPTEASLPDALLPLPAEETLTPPPCPADEIPLPPAPPDPAMCADTQELAPPPMPVCEDTAITPLYLPFGIFF